MVPPALAAAEMNRSSGKDLITACALAFEVGMRVGMALGSYRDVKDGKTSLPPVTGHSSAVFGGATGVAKLLTHEESWNEGGAWVIRTPEKCYRYTPNQP